MRRITSAILSAAVFGMPGGRVFSCKRPSTPATMNRSCQRQTQVFDLPVADMIALVPIPSADNRMIRARQTCFCGEDGAEMTASRRRRSVGETANSIPVRITLNRTYSKTWESKFGLLRSGQSTRACAGGAARLGSKTLRARECGYLHGFPLPFPKRAD